MIKISVNNSSKYPVSSVRIKKCIRNLLKKKGIVSDTSVSVAIVNEKKMVDISKKYYKDENEQQRKAHPVFSFLESEVEEKFVKPESDQKFLGEIVINFERVKALANQKDKLLDEIACELAEHGTLHLLGIHHD